MIPREKLMAEANRLRARTAKFLGDIVACPSHSGTEKRVADRIRREMRAVGFDEVKIDKLGNVIGRIGRGRKVILYDSHIDTVGVGDPAAWKGRNPFRLAARDGYLWGRGACDNKGSMACMVHGGGLLKRLGLTGDFTLYVTGSTFEEDCDGLGQEFLINKSIRKPHLVCLGEPTDLNVYRGHRGRMEIEVRTQGLSCHGSAPERGVNAIYKMAPIVGDIERLNERLSHRKDPFLGHGSVTISQIRSTSPSLCAVADSSAIHLDRRLTVGDTLESAVAEIASLDSVKRAEATVTVLDYARPSYTGLVYPTKKYYPTWTVDEQHPAIAAAVAAGEYVLGRRPAVGKWTFSTNGIATCGLFHVPTVGFGPGHEIYAHSPDDQCPVDHLTEAAAFYAAFPGAFVRTRGGRR